MELPEKDRQALIEAARRRGQGGAAFGVYPSSGKRPEKLNVSRDVNMPAQVARGWVAGTLGLPGDIEELGRLLLNVSPAGREHERSTGKSFVGETPALPTSDFYKEWLPGGDERPAAKFASGLGALAGGVGSTTLARGAVKGAKATGKALGPKAAEMAESYLLKSGLAPSVIKPKGGNWLTGDVEKQTGRLRNQQIEDQVYLQAMRNPEVREPYSDWLNQKLSESPEYRNVPGIQAYNQFAKESNLPAIRAEGPEAAVNEWIDTKLNKYIRNEMGTPEDPVRKLAERDVLHFEPQQVFGDAPSTLMRKRASAGMPTPLFGKSEMARKWESLADRAVDPFPAASYKYGALDENFQASNPWLEKVPDEAMVYKAKGLERNMGFDHLIDELRNATRADSDLPANLRWKPEDLKKVTMEQAVERVAKINEYRAAKKAEADELLSRNPATFQFKDYQTVPGTQEPNSKGLSWKQIQPPNLEMPQGIKRVQQSATQGGIDVPGVGFISAKWDPKTGLDWAGAERDAKKLLGKKPLQEALDYEADVMGHCVRGYCNDVLSGNKQIYSLRDKKGEPHVTIEVKPPKTYTEDDVIEQFPGGVTDAMKQGDVGAKKYIAAKLAEMNDLNRPQEIIQIKGKGNAAPKEEYLPFVQDFVRSGNWSRVGDLKNTGLIEVGEKSAVGQMLKQAGETNIPPYVTRQEYDQIIERFGLRPGFGLPQGYAKGGLVEDTDAIAAKLTGMDKDKALTHALRMANAKQEAHMAAGGLAALVKGAKAAKATKAAEEAAKAVPPTVMPPVKPMTKEEMRPIAQRVAGQMTGEFVRPNPKLSINPAGKSQKVFQRERELPVKVVEKIPQKPAEPIDIEKYEGYGIVGVPGDPTIGGVAKPGSLSQIHEGAAELRKLGDVEFQHPVQLFGGPRYGAYNPGEEFWASNIGPARTLQNRITATSEALDAPVLGQYIKMSPESTNFALHNLDALLSYMEPEKLSKSKLQELNEEIRKGSPKLGQFPGFAGFEDPIDVLLQSQIHSDLRKHIAETLMKPTVAKKYGLRPGSDVLFGISKPELRELEPGISGYSVGLMKPGADLTPSLHPTYDYDIPGTFIGQSKYPTPYEIAFPASTAYTRSQLKPGVQEFNMLKMVGPREKIDPQYIDQIKMYEELMKEYTGKKKGGLVKKSGLSVLNKAII